MGINVLPPKQDGTKAPDGRLLGSGGRWQELIQRRVTDEEVTRWTEQGLTGVGVITGNVSGGLEMLEFEGRAVDEGIDEQFLEAAQATGLGPLVQRIYRGYLEMTPTGGYHLYYRCSTPRSHPLARRPATAVELETNLDQKVKVLIETKGEGGYSITAPTNGSVHPSGLGWHLLIGGWDTVASISDDEHSALLSLARSFDRLPPKQPPRKSPDVKGARPGDLLNERGSWATDVLEPAGWTYQFTRSDGTQYWCRPGKTSGISATVNHCGHDALFVFTSSTPLDSDTGYTKFTAYAMLHHGGDFAAAAMNLHEKGYQAEGQPPDKGRFFLQSMADVEMRPVEWLWSNLIPFGKLTSAEGDPESGKSLFTMDLAARISSERPLPDGSKAPPCAVLLICDEDDYEDTIAPRLEAAGADLTRILALFVQKNEAGEILPFVIPDDMPVLEEAIGERAVVTGLPRVLVVVDPATSYLSERINSNNDASVRKAMSPLAMLARDTGAAILLVRHLNKNTSEKNHKYRGGGSIAFFAAVRASLMFGPHPDDPSLMVMAQAKKNIATAVPSLAYRIVSCDENPLLPVIDWKGAVDVDARTVVGGRDARTEAPERDEAASVLSGMLEEADGTLQTAEAFRVCKGLGISQATVRRAAKKMGLTAKAVRNEAGKVDHWLWAYPIQGSKVRLRAHVKDQVAPDEPR